MKIKLILILSILFLLFCGTIPKRQRVETTRLNSIDTISKWEEFQEVEGEEREIGWKEDIDYMVKVLENNHKNLFHTIEKREFYEEVEGLKREINNLSNGEIIYELKKIVAKVGDGHTKVQDYLFLEEVLPIVLEKYKEGYIIIGATKENEDLIANKLLGINGVEITKIEEKINESISRDNEVSLNATFTHYLTFVDYLKIIGVVEDKVILNLLTEEGENIEKEVKVISVDNYPKDWVNLVSKYSDSAKTLQYRYFNNYYAFEYIADKELLYIQYNQCSSDENYPIDEFIKDVSAFIENNQVNYLLFDMRNNSGGNSNLVEPLIKKIKKDKRINKEGHLFVAIGKNTYSSAILNTLKFKEETKAILIGRKTGGSPNHYGEILSFNLPNSGLILNYSIKYFKSSDLYGNTITPDIILDNSLFSILKGSDEVEVEVLNRIGNE